jgi:PAS domain S-box-containing protein
MPDARATLDPGDTPLSDSALSALAAAFQQIAIGMAVVSPDGRMIDANPALARMLGYERTELLQLGFDAIDLPDEHGGEPSQWQRMVAGQLDAYDRQKPYRRKSGALLWTRITASALRDERGQFAGALAQFQDITPQKTAEAALRDHASQLEGLVGQLPVALYSLQPGGHANYRYVSPRFERLTGLTRDDLPSRFSAWLERVHPDDRAAVRTADEHAGRTGEPAHIEYRIRGGDGAWIWIDNASQLTRDERGRPVLWYGTLLVVSEQKRLEAALHEKQAQLQTLIDNLPAALYRQSAPPDGSATYVNPSFAALIGVDPGSLPLGFPAFFQRIHPDDRDAAVQRAMLAERSGEPFDLEYRLQRADGDWIWIHDRSVLERDEHGRPGAWTGVLLDISTRKRLESALRDSEVRFRRAFENAAIGMTLGTPDHRCLDANAAYCRMVGVSREELIGRSFADVTYPDDRASEARLVARLRAGEIDAYEMVKRYPRPDGSIVTGLLTVSAVRDDTGALLYDIGLMQDITAQKVAEASLRESETRFRSTFEGAGIGMALSTPDGTIMIANPALETLLGYAPGQLAGVHIDAITFADDLASQRQTRRRVNEGEVDRYQLEKRFVRKDGGIVWGLLNASVIRDERGAATATIGQVQDITARKEAEAALLHSEARLRALVQNDPDVFIIVSDVRKLTYVSPSAASAFGVAADELLGPVERVIRHLHPADVDHVRAVIDQIGQRPRATASVEARIRHRSLGWRWFQIAVANLLQDPGIRGYLFNLRDITERKRAEIATVAALKTKQAALEELEQLNQSKSQFLSTISHEFRTPLTAIIGYSELLANAPDAATVADDLAVIHREASRLGRMVDDILLIDRIDAGHLPLNPGPVDLNALARDVAETFRPLAERHTVSLELDPALPGIDGDRDRLSQALTNLVSNAVKYSPEGGNITVVTRGNHDGVYISVRDEGIGIAADDLSRIFDRFERVESGITGRIAGTGLGLAIAREIAGLHGGRLWAESELGVGSTFYLAIPARRQVGESESR